MEKSINKSKVGQDLTEGSIMKGLLIFTVPIILANLIQQLYGIVDLAVIGQFTDSTGTVGVSTGGEISDLLTPIAAAFGTAGQIFIAQLVGAKEHDRSKKAIGTLLTMMMTLSLLVTVVSLVLHKQILNLLNCPEEAFSQASSYLIITAIGFPFIFGYNAVCGVLRGMGESKRPLLFVIVAAVVNVFLDIMLVAWVKLGVAGTAIATVASQAASFIAALIYMYKRKEEFEFEFKLSYFKIDVQALKVMLSLGLPIAIKSMLVRFSMLWVNAQINDMGLVASATNGVGNKLQKFLEVFCQSTSQASAAMVGQNLGARKFDRAKKIIWDTLIVNLILAACSSMLSLLIPEAMFGLFNKDPEVIALGVVYLRIMIAHFFFSALTNAFQAMVIGSGASTLNFAIGMLDGVVCKVGLSLIFVYVMKMDVTGFFWGTALSRALPALICMVYFLSGAWSKRKLLSE